MLPGAEYDMLTSAAAVPDSLVAFAEQTVDNLSDHAPFTSWAEAELEFTPLGPGTHGWLVTLSEDGLPQGYLIITAIEEGGYSLSEYGIGSTLPFSQAPLVERLAAEHLLEDGAGLPQGSSMRSLYSNITPVWEIKLPRKKPIYISALTGEALPMETDGGTHEDKNGGSHADTVFQPPSKREIHSDALQAWATEAPSLARKAPAPYSNLLWVTAPGMEVRSSSELRTLLQKHSSLVFTAGARNAAFGGPFCVSGWQRWHAVEANNVVIYAAVPLDGSDTIRFLPASSLAGNGVFHVHP